MEEFKKRQAWTERGEKDIVFSKSIKAGKRIYYLDVKKNRKDEMFLAITESKKVVMGEGDASQVNFEKHKIFLYREDFEKFMNGLSEVVKYIVDEQGPFPVRERYDEAAETDGLPADSEESIKIDIDF